MSGSLVEDEEHMRMEELWNTRREEIRGFRTAILSARKEEMAHATQQTLRREKRAEFLLQCKKDIRAANRDTLFKETLRCFRGLVVGDMEIIRKEQQAIATRAALPANQKSAADSVLQQMMDALTTVTSAIDAGVYRTKEDLQEAKKNLHEKYRAPILDTMIAVRLTRRDQWITLLLVNLRDNMDAETLPEPVMQTMNDAIACLEQKQVMIRSAVPGKRSETLRTSALELQVCIGKITEANSLYKEFEQQKTSSGSGIQ